MYALTLIETKYGGIKLDKTLQKLVKKLVRENVTSSSQSTTKKSNKINKMNRGGKNVPVDAERFNSIFERLSKVDTSALCDAEKGFSEKSSSHYKQLKVMDPYIKPQNLQILTNKGVEYARLLGIARTVQLTQPNDFLAMIRGLDESECGDVLVVNTLNSNRAVAGGLFAREAMRKNLGGIVIDGPMRDMQSIRTTNLLCFSSSVTPYSGTVQSIGETQVPIQCGGIEVIPGELVVGDADGVIVGSIETFESIIDGAEHIVQAESKLMSGMEQGQSLVSMTNYVEHFMARKEGKDSTLEFR